MEITYNAQPVFIWLEFYCIC